jgi:hypothetical protein
LSYQLTLPAAELRYLCEEVVDHAATTWGPQAVSGLMETLLPVWPPPVNALGKPYPAEALDEWRFRLGVWQALAGNPTAAVQHLSEVNSHPAPGSRWQAPAAQFLASYQGPAGLYRACQAEAQCDMRAALAQATRDTGLSDPSLALDALQGLGVTVRTAGYFDFDQDGETERWAALRQRASETLEFWILARAPGGVRALFVDAVEVNNPQPYFYSPMQSPPIFQLTNARGFRLNRASASGEPYITEHAVDVVLTSFTTDAIDTAIDTLFAGGSPAQVRDTLHWVGQSPNFECRRRGICDQFYYVLALAYELSGQPEAAVNSYIAAWWEDTGGPYAVMARYKVMLKPTVTPTPKK